ncbi:MAG: bifunctional phosphopantothenoylcysteine decarboxylase/phosphopantothenate--cysteine ligase CoaBC [Nitrospirae bacterium]|nr:MAG: bifunctional phosphopantothenoylcysteine decarboxylase/phosphopantothenate--cysteine ligase CoaBC [Nitrospirota bacterium]
MNFLNPLKNRSVLLGITGGVAAYKSVELARRLYDEEASVVTIMTEASRHFITPLSLEVASRNRVYTSLWEDPLAHIRLPKEADITVIAPATANLIAKFSQGIADDLLSTCLLSCSSKKVIIAPAMNWRMYENPAVQRNLSQLTSQGVILVGPEQGSLACGEEGTGRMAGVPEIIDAIRSALTKKDLVGERIVVTAGPTREYLDPVRFISNRSSGKMGYALAAAARDRGAVVTLISGPTSLQPPAGVRYIPVETAAAMFAAVTGETARAATMLVMAAAVADFSPETRAETKLGKKDMPQLKLRMTDDIIAAVASSPGRPFIVGFAAETGRDLDRARQKMRDKQMDMIVFNDVAEPGAGFDVDTNRVVIIDRSGEQGTELMSKNSVAHAIFDRVREIKA